MSSEITQLSNVNLDGFQLVSGEMFNHFPKRSEATCTIWSTSISFSNQAVIDLNNCEHINIQINAKSKCMLVVPITSKDKDAIRWTKGVKEPKARKMECKSFTNKLYETWNLRPDFIYRAKGKLVLADKKLMLLFDFNDAENWVSKQKSEGA